jgi:hypothetical protein
MKLEIIFPWEIRCPPYDNEPELSIIVMLRNQKAAQIGEK